MNKGNLSSFTKHYNQIRGKLASVEKGCWEIIAVGVLAYLVARFILPAFLK